MLYFLVHLFTPWLGLFQFSDFFPFFSSNDLAWDGESKRIIAVGDGKEKSVISDF